MSTKRTSASEARRRLAQGREHVDPTPDEEVHDAPDTSSKHDRTNDAQHDTDHKPPSRTPDPAQAGGTKYPTGIEVPPDVHARVQKAVGTRNTTVRQTEVLLSAFEKVFPRIPELVARYKRRHQVTSPLFGTRTVQVAEKTSAMKRLQIRPTWNEYRALRQLADQYELPLAVLTRLVLRDYFRMDAPAAAAAAEPTSPNEPAPATP